MIKHQKRSDLAGSHDPERRKGIIQLHLHLCEVCKIH